MTDRIITEDWDFKDADTKEFTHCFHTYPAMMIPQIARKLINEYAPEGQLELLFDPYMGSGTSLVEASIKGINAIGTDINPLACLISKVKTTKYHYHVLEAQLKDLKRKISSYNPSKFDSYEFNHITKVGYWYSEENLMKLSFLTRILDELDNEEKDFFKVILSEIIREASYTRNGEFKRYRIAKEKIPMFNIDPFKLFIDKSLRNIEGAKEYSNIKSLGIAGINNFNTSIEIPAHLFESKKVDMIITSPPYGDSKTTVAYGQFSRWSNEWFRHNNAKNLDDLLMGGKTRKDFTFSTESIKKELDTIKSIDSRRYYEVASFLEDYYNSILNVSKVVRSGGRVCYVVGNRNVKEVQIPLDYFTVEMFEKNGFKHDYTLVRSIPNKRMPNKTSPSNKKGKNISTMTSEYIVILTKKQ